MTLLYVVTYLVIGALTYQLVTKQFYAGDEPVFALYLRSEEDAAQWNHVERWQLPLLLVRSLLLALVMLPLIGALRAASFRMRAVTVFGLVFVLTHLASAAPSPGNIEGIVYLRPELVSARIFLLTQIEMILQGLVFALGAAHLIGTWSGGHTKED